MISRKLHLQHVSETLKAQKEHLISDPSIEMSRVQLSRLMRITLWGQGGYRKLSW